MRGCLTRSLGLALILGGLASPAFAQNSTDPGRGASFLPSGVGDLAPATTFTGLATEKQQTTLTAPVPGSAAPAQQDQAKVPDLGIAPVSMGSLPNVSPESVGMQGTASLGADVWKGTNRAVAERLLSLVAPTSSPVLNTLVLRLLKSAAVPPEGETDSPQRFTSKRLEKLVAFGDAPDAWALAKQADPKLIDSASYYRVASSMFPSGDDHQCDEATLYAKSHPGADWQEFNVLCRLRVKDAQAAQVALDVLHTQDNRDNIFISVAERNVLGGSKSLPFQLTPLTPETLGLLRLANLPLPGSLLTHADYAHASVLIKIPAQQDVTQLGLAERALERGLVDIFDVAAVYRSTIFSQDALSSPMTSVESGSRLRALLFRASEQTQDQNTKIALAVKLAQSAQPSFINGASLFAARIIGDAKSDPQLAKYAAVVARAYMIAGKTALAQDWFKLAQGSSICADDMQAFWPQFVLGGLEPDSAFAADFTKWFDAALKNADDQTVARVVAPTVLLFDAAGIPVPEAAWAKILIVQQNEKKVAFSPILFGRLNAAASAHKRAETILAAAILSGDGDISLPVALGITRALGDAGLKNESLLFARQAVAMLNKDN